MDGFRGAQAFLPGEQHVKIAGVAELAREPADLLPKLGIILAAHRRPEQRQGRAQPAQRDPRLVQRIGVAPIEQHDLVQPVVAQAGLGDGAEGLALVDPDRQRDRVGFGGLTQRLFLQRIATLGFAQHAEAEGQRCADLPGQREEGARLARLELELKLAERRVRLAGGDLAFVQHHLDHAAPVGHQPRRPAEARAEL